MTSCPPFLLNLSTSFTPVIPKLSHRISVARSPNPQDHLSSGCISQTLPFWVRVFAVLSSLLGTQPQVLT